MHLFLYGKSGAGKSTAIRRALKETGLTPQGFCSVKRDGGLYLCPAADPNCSPGEQVARFFPEGITADPAAFDRLGIGYLAGLTPDRPVLMDELGTLEQDACAFRSRVLQVLDGPCAVLGVIKPPEDRYLTSWLAEIYRHPRVQVLPVSQAARDSAFTAAASFLAQFRSQK